jgi:predicted O-methyltransferase YrrM
MEMGTASVEKAIALVREGHQDLAETVFAAVLEKNPNDLEARGHRAWLFVCTGRYEDAIADYLYLMERDPNDIEAAFRYAEVLSKMGRHEESILAARNVLDHDPKHLAALDLWRRCLASLSLAEAQPPERDFSHANDQAHPLTPVIRQWEKVPAIFPASVFPQVGQMLYSLVRCVRPRLVLETGCFVGYSTLCIAQALEENTEGHIHSFDLFLPLAPDYHSPVAGNCTDALQVARAHLEKSGLAHRVTFHKGDSSTGITEVLTADHDVVDLAFIDGDHLVKGCFKDWNSVLRLLRPGGTVVLHDVFPNQCGWIGPHALVKELRRHPREFQAVNLPTPEGYGLGVVQRISGEHPNEWNPPLLALLKEYLQRAIWRWRERSRGK